MESEVDSRRRSALVAGSTGLIGGYVVDLLAAGSHYAKLFALVRRSSAVVPKGVSAVKVDFDALGEGEPLPTVNDVYICLGTTMKNAGSKENFRSVDFDYVVRVAEQARAVGATRLAVVSSVGASAASRTFYLRVKGEMEAAISQLGFERLSILRPGLLLGERPTDKRLAEGISQKLMPLIDPLLRGNMMRYRSVHGESVARAMIAANLSGENGTHILEYGAITALAERCDTVAGAG